MRRLVRLLALLSLVVASFVGTSAEAQSLRCIPGFGESQPGDRCDDVTLDSRNPLPDGYVSFAMSAGMKVGAAWSGSKADAESKALASCTQHGGQNCKIVRTLFNSCGSIAGSEGEKIAAFNILTGAGWNASGMAMDSCRRSGGRSCHVLVNACYNGYVSPNAYKPPSANAPKYEAPVLRRPRS